jgi:hypothetical protein
MQQLRDVKYVELGDFKPPIVAEQCLFSTGGIPPDLDKEA